MKNKETKSNGELVVLDNFKTTKQHITVEFKDRVEATYNDIKGYSLHGPYLVIQMQDDTQFIFPMDQTRMLTVFTTKE